MKEITRKNVLRDFKIKRLRMREISHLFTWIKYNMGFLGTMWIWEP